VRHILFLCSAIFLLVIYEVDAFSHVPGEEHHISDQRRAELNEWFNTVKSGRGPCCSNGDGDVVSDSDWVSQDKPGSHYRVKLPYDGNSLISNRFMTDGKNYDWRWVDVPDDAVVTQPNLYGRTMVWPVMGEGSKMIRCFMPGSMT
jgi:hypothetical protein